MKFQLHENLTHDQVKQRLPKYLSTVPMPPLDPDTTYTLVVFRNNNEVVMSKQVEHALKKVTQTPVVAGRNFTQQAYDAVTRQKGFVIAASNFTWSDESYYNITHPQRYPS